MITILFLLMLARTFHTLRHENCAKVAVDGYEISGLVLRAAYRQPFEEGNMTKSTIGYYKK